MHIISERKKEFPIKSLVFSLIMGDKSPTLPKKSLLKCYFFIKNLAERIILRKFAPNLFFTYLLTSHTIFMAMRKSFFSILTAALLTTVLFSCTTKQTAINKLERFSYELRDNGQYYTVRDWENAAEKFTDIRQKINKYDYSAADRKYIGELEGKCAGYVYEGVKGKVKNMGSELSGILEGLMNIIQR